ncbi:MAG: lytic murein transglycosylase [Rhizomicrobium sp.]
MAGIKRNDKIETLTEAQPEFVKQVWTYLDTAASPRRVADGRAALASQAAALATVEAKYGVPQEILVSLWGNRDRFRAARSAASTSSRRWRRWPMTGRAAISAGPSSSPR